MNQGPPIAPYRVVGGRLEATATPLRDLVSTAYGLSFGQRVIGSTPLLDRTFTIVAKIPDGLEMPPARNGPRPASHPVSVMLRTLLEDRFQLRTRWQNESQDVGVLKRASETTLGPKLRSVAEGCVSTTCGHRQIDGRMTGVSDLDGTAFFLSVIALQRIVNETGLEGAFDIDVTFDPSTLSRRPDAPRPLPHLPSFADAFRRELGLKLDYERREVPMLVVERVVLPVEN